LHPLTLCPVPWQSSVACTTGRSMPANSSNLSPVDPSQSTRPYPQSDPPCHAHGQARGHPPAQTSASATYPQARQSLQHSAGCPTSYAVLERICINGGIAHRHTHEGCVAQMTDVTSLKRCRRRGTPSRCAGWALLSQKPAGAAAAAWMMGRPSLAIHSQARPRLARVTRLQHARRPPDCASDSK